jgi:DNA polymerase III subunit epsilon
VAVRGLLTDRVARLVAGVVGYVAAALALLALVVWASLTPPQRSELAEVVASQAPTFILGGLLVGVGLVVLLVRGLGAYPRTARRLAGDVRVLLGPNPDHRPDVARPPEMAELAQAVGDLADRRATAEREVAREVSAARADVEQERNRLAALMADLGVAVLVCSSRGRMLLYNAAARALLGDDPALGLGRSVFGIVDRGLVTHALDRIADGSVHSHVSTVLRDGRLLEVRLTPVRTSEREVTGFVLVLEDTGHLQASRQRDALLRGLTESTRASAAGVRAAVETVLDYPDMDPDERGQFLEIIREESARLGDQVDHWSAAAAGLRSDWSLTDMAGDDLLAVLGRELEREAGVAVAPAGPAPAQLWLRVDSHALARAVGHLAQRLRERCGVEQLQLRLQLTGRHGRLEARWDGRAPEAEDFRDWLEEPLPGGVAASVREVVERHDAEVWVGALDGGASLRLLLPVTDTEPRPQAQAQVAFDSRPEFYDFDLFDLPEQSQAWNDRRLGELSYTVFDTETTGFSPTEGDEIVAIGAVRVVNGRLRRHETFERLVDPRRRVPAQAAAVHGITTDMVQGQPPLEAVLPLFQRFAEDMVLVGHNVGFDMSFFRARESRTGVRFEQPVLDTLLLDAVLHPDHDAHSLEAIAARLGVDVTGRHTALGDALLTGEVFVRQLGLLQQRGITTLGEALSAAQETYHARLDARLYGG